MIGTEAGGRSTTAVIAWQPLPGRPSSHRRALGTSSREKHLGQDAPHHLCLCVLLCPSHPFPEGSSPADSHWHHSEVSWGQHGHCVVFSQCLEMDVPVHGIHPMEWVHPPMPAMGAPLPTATQLEYSSLLTRVICLKTKISSDYRKEQHFSTLLVFGDTICSSFHVLFSFIGCRVVKKRMRYIYHVHRRSTKVTVPGCRGGGGDSGVLLVPQNGRSPTT